MRDGDPTSRNSRLAVVTGASSGIGLAVARHLADQQYDLVLVARREERLKALADEITSTRHVQVYTLGLDLSATGASMEVKHFLETNDLQVDLLVNNAGFGLVGRFAELDRERQLNMIQLNVVAVTDLTRLLLPDMISRGHGRIVNVASSAAFQPAPLMGVYHATKSFVLFLTEALAEELRGTGVTATVVCPGPVGQTEFGDHTGTDEKVPGLGLVRVDAADVARIGLKAATKGKVVSVPGLIMRLSSMVTPRLPRALVRKATHLIQRSRVVPDR
jgi:short-subunit dehydrogenase